MNPKIQIRHEAANEQIRERILSEFERLRDSYHMTSAEVVVDQEGPTGHLKTVEVNVHVPSDILVVKESSHDIKQSVSAAFITLEKRLQKYKAVGRHGA